MIDEKLTKKFVLNIIQIVHQTGGVTLDLSNLSIVQPKNRWYFPKYPSKTKIIFSEKILSREIIKFTKENILLFQQKKIFLGIWINPDTSEYYFDITTYLIDRKEAIKMARIYGKEQGRKILSIYNPKLKKIVYL